MTSREGKHNAAWEHRQHELWERMFQVTGDVVALAEEYGDDVGSKIAREGLVKAAMVIGVELVHANAADSKSEFLQHLKSARQHAIEADYWLRLGYVLQQSDQVQQDLSGIVAQYATIIDSIRQIERHIAGEKNAVKRHARGPKVS